MTTLQFAPRCTYALGLLLCAVAVCGAGVRSARAADDGPFARVEADVRVLAEQLKDAKQGSQDLLGSIAAIEAAFFRLEADRAPGGAAQVRLDPEQASQVKAWQGRALDGLMRALTAARQDPRTKENRLAEVNLRAAVALGNLLGSADLAVNRSDKEVAKLRAERARALRETLETTFGKPRPGRVHPVSAALLDAVFTALGRTNDPATLDWLRDEHMHTRSGDFEEVRLLAAHKAMLLFTNVPGKVRHGIARQVIVSYRGTAASAAQNPPVNKAFWDRIKFGVVEVFRYYATAPGGGPPENAQGEALHTIEALHVWWRHHDDPTKAPWLDPKAQK